MLKLVLLSMLAGGLIHVNQQESKCLIVDVPNGLLDLREGPGTGYRVSEKIRVGDVLFEIAFGGGWAWVQINYTAKIGPISGWVDTRYVHPYPCP